MTRTFARSFAVVAMALASATVTAAQPAANAEALRATFSALQTPEPMTETRFFVDPDITRQTASDEVEARLEQARADVMVRDAELRQQEAIQAVKEMKALAAEVDLQNAIHDLDLKTQAIENPHDVDVLDNFSFDDQQAFLQNPGELLQKAKQRKEKAKQALEDAKKELDAAETAVETAGERVKEARASESKRIEEQKQDIEKIVKDAPIKAGAFLQRDTIVIRLRPTTTIPQILGLLQKYRLRVRGGIASIALLITQFDEPTNSTDDAAANRLKDTIDQILRDERSLVFNVYPNVLLGGTMLPPRSTDLPAGLCYDFTPNCTGSAAAVAMNFPAAWNVVPAMLKRQTPRVTVAVLDEGFSPHNDLPMEFFNDPSCTSSTSRHGNHVAGIIGANFTNGSGVAGASPFVDLVVCAPQLATQSHVELLARIRAKPAPFTAIALAFEAIATKRKPKVVNVSIGYQWVVDIGVVPDDNNKESDEVRSLVANQGATIRALMAQHSDTIVVSAAGNDCLVAICSRKAMWTSPFNWAALADRGEDGIEPSANVFVVQANRSDRSGTRFARSNVDATIAAPGVDVVSTSDLNTYEPLSGTSMAAPYITALVAFMRAYEPSLAIAKIRTILEIGQPKMPDAFQALKQTNETQFAQDIADIDDNERVDQNDITMFESHFVDYQTGRARTPKSFDHDLNGDGAFDDREDLFPRCDIDGDGEITTSVNTPIPVEVPSPVPSPMSDLDHLSEIVNGAPPAPPPT